MQNNHALLDMLRGPGGAVDGAFRRGAPNRAVGDSYMPARVAMAWWMLFFCASSAGSPFAHLMSTIRLPTLCPELSFAILGRFVSLRGRGRGARSQRAS